MELLQNVKKGVADVVTAKKRLQLQQQKLEQQVVKLDTQARQALAAGPRGSRAHRARAQAVRPDRAADARPAGRRARGSSSRLIDKRAEAARQARAVPHQEGGHQGAVLGRRGAGEDLRGGDGRGRGDGRRRPRDAARDGQDGEHARAGRRDGGARGRRRVRRQPHAHRRPGRHRPPAAPAHLGGRGGRRPREAEGRARPGRGTRRPRSRRASPADQQPQGGQR